jgi:DNA polymerase/3'-5' exonuclease PolX
MNNEAIARRFERLALIMEIRGDDRYRIRSYRNAAGMIETWSVPLTKVAREAGVKGLQAIPGIGKAISGKIMELIEHGTFEAYEKLMTETPETVLDLLDVSGIGIKTAATLTSNSKSLRLLISSYSSRAAGWRWLTAWARRRRNGFRQVWNDFKQCAQRIYCAGDLLRGF